MKRNGLVIFFVLAFLLPWLVWGTSIAQERGVLGFHIPQSLAFWVGLTLATYISALISDGWDGVKDLLKRLVRWQVKPVWYVVSLALPGVLAAIAIGAHMALGGSIQIGVLLSSGDLLPSLLFQIFFFLITEETAWRGFALPRLQARYTALNASLILGVLWGLWHLPLVFIADSFQASVPFTGFVLSAIATTIIFTWVFNHSRGSVLIAAILHAATDVTIAYSNVMTGDLRLFWIFIIVQWIFAGYLVWSQGVTHLSKQPDLKMTHYSS